MLPFASPLLPMLLAAGGALAYGEWQRKRGQDSSNKTAAAATDSDDKKQRAQTIYNYNGMDDSTLGRTLFNTSGTTQNKMLAGRNKTLFS